MQTTEKIEIGQIVKSISGRDSGKTFIIIDILDDKYVLLVDGDLRRLDNPKRKKVKHLIPTKVVLDKIKNKIEAKEKFNNAYVRKLLASFNKEN